MVFVFVTACLVAATPVIAATPGRGRAAGTAADAGVPAGAPSDAGVAALARAPEAGLADAGRVDAGRPLWAPDAGLSVDAGRVVDAGGQVDAGRVDGGPVDARRIDGGPVDAGPVDGGPVDAGLSVDAGRAVDGGPGDAGRAVDAGPGDAGRVDGGPADAGGPVDGGRRVDPGQRDGGVARTSPAGGGDAAFLIFPGPPNAADGTILPEADLSGPAGSMMRYAEQQQVDRERELGAAQRSLATVNAALDRFFKTSGGERPRDQRDELAQLADTVLERARMAYFSAMDHERRRLSWVVKVVRDAEAAGEENPLPAVNLELLLARQAVIRDGRVRKAIDARIKGYRGLMMGIVAWVDGDTFRSLEQLKAGVAGAPDLPLAHLYLGYLHFILENPKDALAEWRKALELDPTNETIKKLIADHNERNERKR